MRPVYVLYINRLQGALSFFLQYTLLGTWSIRLLAAGLSNNTGQPAASKKIKGYKATTKKDISPGLSFSL